MKFKNSLPFVIIALVAAWTPNYHESSKTIILLVEQQISEQPKMVLIQEC